MSYDDDGDPKRALPGDGSGNGLLVPKKKKARLPEPDVTIIVGGKTFKEHSFHLSRISDYFDAAFSSGMKEAQSMTFEFPDKDPDEWELMMKLSEPFSDVLIDDTNLSIALSWCSEFCMPGGLKHCDRALLKILHSRPYTWVTNPSQIPDGGIAINFRQNVIERFLHYLESCYHFNLPMSLAKCAGMLLVLFLDGPTLFREQEWATVCRLLSEQEALRDMTWGAFSTYLPASVKVDKDDANAILELLANPLLPSMIHSEVQRRKKDETLLQLATQMKKNHNCSQLRNMQRILSTGNGKFLCNGDEEGKYNFFVTPSST